MIFISPMLKDLAKGKRDNLIDGKEKTENKMVDPNKQKEMLRRLAETKVKMNK